MTIVNVIEEQNLSKYLVITQQKDPSTLITTRVVITDNANNRINLVNIERGIQGDIGPQGLQGIPGKDGMIFDVLPIASGGTNNTVFSNDKIVYFDGLKLTSSIYSVDELINSQNAITGIVTGSGLSKIDNGKNITLNTNLGDGLTLSNNAIVVDDTIARKSEISLGTVLPGAVPINKGGTNNTSFFTNTFVYFDGTKLTSFPLDTGRIVTSGSVINIVAGSGLVGGGQVSIPGGSVVINIPNSSDIAVLDNIIELSATGTAGTYTKVTTDTKGRVVSGTQLTQADIISALGYTPWNPTNDGQDSGLDADLLDGKHGSFYTNLSNLTGTISTGILPNIVTPGLYSKVSVNSKGLVLGGSSIDSQDVYNALGYRPVSTSGDTITGNLDIAGSLNVQHSFTLKDNLPEFGYNNYSLFPNAPRGFSFTYGSVTRRTGILAYYPDDNQLRLITNIYGTGVTDLDGSISSETNYNGDVDGGDASSIYLMGNLDGDQAVVLLQHIADTKYISLTKDQIVNGIKSFNNYISVKNFVFIQNMNQGGPPLYVDGNSVLVDSLNVDFLDGEHGAYYRNAANITGYLNYATVNVTHISGTNTYIPKFDNRTPNPSRTITDSIVFQSGDNLIVVEDGSLSIGKTNKISSSESLAIGSSNNITSDNSLAAGYKNTISGDNSVAINYQTITRTDNSLAMGKHGTTWIENQLSIGAFEELNPVNQLSRIGHGQQSTAALGYYGEAQSYTSMFPNITVPNNKTVLYNLDLLFSKFGSSGVASFRFASGIIKNTNGILTNIKSPIKQELYNSSQIRNYPYNIKINSNDINKNQTLSVTQVPLKANSPEIQNFPSVVKIKPNLSEISGQFFKTLDGNILLNMSTPIFSGWFTQSFNDKAVYIKSYDHGMVPGAYVNLQYIAGISGSVYKPTRGSSISGVRVTQVIDKDNFVVSNLSYNGVHEQSGTVFISYGNLISDPSQQITLSGTINQDSSVLSNLSYLSGNAFINDLSSIKSSILPNMLLRIFNSNVVDTLDSYPVRIASTGDGAGNFQLTINTLYTGLTTNTSFGLYDYPIFALESSQKAFFNSEEFNTENTFTNFTLNNSGVRFDIVGYDNQTKPTGRYDITVTPVINYVDETSKTNSGIMYLHHKRSYDCWYGREKAVFTPYNVTYTHNKSDNGLSSINFSANSEINFLNNYDPYVEFLTATNSFSGILTSGSNLITDCYPTQAFNIVTGLLLHVNTSDFYYSGIVNDVNGTTLTMNNTFSLCPGSTGVLVVYSGQIPPSAKYAKLFTILNGSGYVAQREFLSPDTGIYFTGNAKVYSNYGYATITSHTLLPPKTKEYPANIADDEFVYIDFKTNNVGLIPIDNTYVTTGCVPNTFKVISSHLMPDSGIACTGFSYATLDKDHGYLDPSSNSMSNVQQQIPLFFNIYPTYSAKSELYISYDHNNNVNRKPKDNILSVIGVTGHQILVNDNRYQLLKETNRSPLYNDYTRSYFNKYYIDDKYYLYIDTSKRYLEINDKIIVNKAFNIENGFINPKNIDNMKFKVANLVDNQYVLQLIENNDELISGVIDDTLIGNSGYISYLGFQDGYVTSPTNGFYFHSYGDGSESWRRDDRGIYINPPLTGFFNIYSSSKLCNSGTLCIHISGISDISYIPVNKQLFFDFIDTDPVLTGLYTVYDKLSNDVLTINIPYDSRYVNNSGLVYLIDALTNIKTDKNPNIDNVFFQSYVYDDIPGNENLSSFNYYNNRWKHGVFLDNSGLFSPTGYLNTTIDVSHDGLPIISKTNTNIIVMNPFDMSFDISYSGINTSNYENLVSVLGQLPSLTTETNSLIYFMVSIKGGAGKWSDTINQCAPLVSILGLKDYSIVNKEFDDLNQEWKIKIQAYAPNSVVNAKNLKFIVSDESARQIKDITLSTSVPFTISNIEQTEYAQQLSTVPWKIFCDIYGGDPPYYISLPGVDVADYDVYPLSNPAPYSDLPNHYTYLIKGTGWYSTTGINTQDIVVSDSSYKNITGTASFMITDYDKTFVPNPRIYKTNLVINKNNPGNNYITFLIPCRNSPPPGTTKVQFTNTQNLVLNNILTSYYYSLDAYRYSIKVDVGNSTETNLYNIGITGSIIQPILREGLNDNFAFNTGVSVNVYQPIAVDTYKLVQPVPYDIDSVWSLTLDIVNGAYYNSSVVGRQLRAYLGNTPNNGRYDSTPLQYKLGYSYVTNDTSPRHRVSFTGLSDTFSVNSITTGIHNLYYYVEDFTSYATGVIQILVDGGIDLVNLHDTKYATPNNGFDINFDIEGLTYGPGENYSIPGITNNDSLKNDPLISFNSNYIKYDPHTKIWEYFYNGSPITDKWDSELLIYNDILDVRVKGLSNDKIYVAGKFDTVETDNVIIVERPFGIKSVSPASIDDDEKTEGEAWEITVVTTGGLEDPFYPPLIKLSNTPLNTCTGYNPADAQNSQECVVPPSWNAASKEWTFKFNGPELCLIGIYNVSIEAKDVIVGSINNGPKQILETRGTASSGAPIVYKSGEAHPPPELDDITNKNLFPNCSPFSESAEYRIKPREVCPQPTGISGVIAWGDLPAGIQFSNSRINSTAYVAPYNDLTPGIIYFNGTPTEFANGGKYPYKFYVNVVDAVGRSGSPKLIEFNDASKPIEISPTDLTIYFDRSGYQYTPELGTEIIDNDSQNVHRPPASEFSMKCLSKLPHNKCVYSSGSYSNVVVQDGIFFGMDITSPQISKILQNNKVYVTFTGILNNDQGQPASLLNGSYTVDSINEANASVRITGTNNKMYLLNLTDPTGGINIVNITDNRKNKSLSDVMNDYFIDESQPLTTQFSLPDGNTSDVTGIMGDGKLGTIGQDTQTYGIYGRIKPIAYTTTTGYPDNANAIFDNVNFHIIPGQEKFNEPYVVQFNNCYETGYLRVSGVIIPKFYIDITDPPPGTEGSNPRYFTQPGDDIGTVTRSSYGDDIAYRGSAQSSINARTVPITYVVKDQINNLIKTNGSLSNESIGLYNKTIAMSENDNVSVYSFYVEYINNTIFPTYKQNVIPSASGIAYWIHSKDGEFPPVYPVDNFQLIIPTGQIYNKQFTFVGGRSDGSSNYYSTNLPKVTGYIEQKRFSTYSGTYHQDQDDSSLKLLFSDPTNLEVNDAIYVEFLTSQNQANFLPSGSGVTISSLSSSLYTISDFTTSSTVEKTGTFIARDLYQIYTDPVDSNNLNIRYNNTIDAQILPIGTGIDLIDSRDKSRSLLGNIFNIDSSVDIPNTMNISALSESPDRIATIYNVSSDYYSNLLGSNSTGLCDLRTTVFYENLAFTQKVNDSATNIGTTTYTLTGILYNPFNTYTYRVITCDNLYWSNIENRKVYGKDFDLVVTAPLTIIPESSGVIDSNPNIVGGIIWNFSFSVTGGYIPRSNDFLEIEIDDMIHTFNRSDTIYESGLYSILTTRPGISWTGSTFNLKVYDRVSVASGTFDIPS